MTPRSAAGTCGSDMDEEHAMGTNEGSMRLAWRVEEMCSDRKAWNGIPPLAIVRRNIFSLVWGVLFYSAR